MSDRFSTTVLFLLAAIALGGAGTGCAKMMGELRRDLDDSDPVGPPTVGGRWAERGFLQESPAEGGGMYGSVGHAERAPASYRGGDGQVAPSSWVSGEQVENNRRDVGRDVESVDPDRAVTFSNNPNVPPPTRRNYKNGARATRADFIDESPNEASLWAGDGQINYYFTKNKIHTVGDIVTITMDDGIVADVATEVRRSLTPQEREREQNLAELRVREAILNTPAAGRKPGTDAVATGAAAPDRTPAANDPTAQLAKLAEMDVGKSLTVKTGDTMLAEVLERYPNGNYKVRGNKRIPYKNGPPRLVTLTGVVKGSDIDENDTLNAGKLYEYRLEAAR